jgi:A/G-specific adenine glycosylase
MQYNQFRNRLIKWYIANQRVLPWRQINDPYAIWVSEIILQQTRVNQGLDYFHRFILRFPDIQTLANASEELVLKTWEGLGYYSRARNMHTTARLLVEKYNGKFPEDPQELEKLKGIGKYTSAAIASIAFNKPVAVVDGNVLRFISRFFGIEESIDDTKTISRISQLANEMISHESPGLFNQAMMEFGALQCVPVNPDCKACPFIKHCVANRTGKVDVLPVKAKKAKLSARYFNYMVVPMGQSVSPSVLIKRRNGNDIWKHLYDFPLIETDKLLNLKQLGNHNEFKSLFAGFKSEIELYPGSYRHLLTHRIIHARFFKASFPEKAAFNFPEGFICAGDVRQYPLPKLINNFLYEHILSQLK